MVHGGQLEQRACGSQNDNVLGAGLRRQHRPHHKIATGVWKGDDEVTMLRRHTENAHTNAHCSRFGETNAVRGMLI